MRWLALLALLVVAVAVHAVTALELHQLWVDTGSTTYTHGYLILAIAVWLLWRQRARINSAPWQPLPMALLGLLGAELAWLLATLASNQLAAMMLLPLIVGLAVLSGCGAAVARRCAFPLAYIYFALPLWSSLNSAAQWTTVYAERVLLKLVGVTAQFDANWVRLQYGSFEIAGGCSGLHFMMVGLAIAALLGELRNDAWRTRVKLAAVALSLAVLTNWVRVLVIIVAGDLTHMQHYLVRVSHYGFGWCLFAVAMALFFWIESQMQTDVMPAPGSPTGVFKRHRWPATVAMAMLLVGVLAVAPAIDALIKARRAPLALHLPAQVGDWSLVAAASDSDWRPVFVGADSAVQGRYQRGADSLLVYLAGYAFQQQGKELGGYLNSVTATRVPEADDVSTYVWAGFQVGDRWFSTAAGAQLGYAYQSLLHLRPSESHVLALRATCQATCSAARAQVTQFLHDWH